MKTIKKIILSILLILFLLNLGCSPPVTKPLPDTPFDIKISET